MFVLFTDFGLNGPYLGQMCAVLEHLAPGTPIINLFADAPVYNPRAAAHLLAAYSQDMPKDSVFLCVVDPGVGTQSRQPIVLEADGPHFVGPDNGLFDVLEARATHKRKWEIVWQPANLSDTFHGRDLFAPIAAHLHSKTLEAGCLNPLECAHKPVVAELAEVIYIDHFGNALTGIRAPEHAPTATLQVGKRVLPRLRTFADAAVGQPFCYANANGLLEIAVNRGRAESLLGLEIGSSVILLNA